MPSYATVQFSALKTELANRLKDPGKVFWPDAELALHIQDALRFWNCLTGDAKQNYALSITQTNPATIWYDLHTVAGSPRLCTLKDTDVYSRLQWALLEPQAANAGLSTAQFLPDDLVQSLQRKRDEFLFRTGCTSSVESISASPNVATIALPETVIQVRRAYWLPTSGGKPFPLPKIDEYATASYQAGAVATPSDPNTFSAGIEPPLTVELTPPPNAAGKVELLTIKSQGVLSPTSATTLLIPNDFVSGLLWGTLADLLDMTLEAKDEARAAYARSRFEQYCELMAAYPFVLGARVAGVPVHVDAVETLDLFAPAWRTLSANPSIVGLSGQNLIAFPTNANMTITLLMNGNATLPVADGDYIQLGREVLDVVLDYAQHTASFKMGGKEFADTMPLFKSIVMLAAKRNAKVRAMSTFRDLLYGIREEEFAAKEVADGGEG